MNNEMIITPITEEEKRQLIDLKMQDNIMVLYRTEKSNDIQIGMLAKAIKDFFPQLTNLDKIQYASDLAYFFGVNGSDRNIDISDRPVYSIKPTAERTVGEYQLLNPSIDNNVWLEDVLEGNYCPKEEYGFRNLM